MNPDSMDPEVDTRRAKHTRSTEVPIRKSEKRSRARPRTVVRKTKSCEVAFTEAPSSIDSTWAQLLDTYSWSKKTKPLPTLPPRRLGLIPRPLTEREAERERQWANAKESGTALPLRLDIWIEIIRVVICTACNQSWYGWYCGTCNGKVPYPYHSSMYPSHISPDFLEARRIFLRLQEERYPERFLNARTQRNMAQVSRAWLYVLLGLVEKKINALERRIRIYKPQSGTPRHMNKTTLNILYTAEKYKCATDDVPRNSAT